MKFGFILVDTKTLRITVTMDAEDYVLIYNCPYIMLCLVCGVLWMQLGLWVQLFFWDTDSLPVCCTHFDTIFWTAVGLWENLCPFEQDASTTISAVHSVMGCFWWQNIKQGLCLLVHSTWTHMNFTYGACGRMKYVVLILWIDCALKQTVCDVVSSVSWTELWRTMNMFVRWSEWLWVKESFSTTTFRCGGPKPNINCNTLNWNL